MGKAISLMSKPVKKFNIENRAHKVISRDKPMPAPSHKSTKKILEVAQTVSPNFLETHNKKDRNLDDRLKNLYVQSHGSQTTEAEPNPDRPLPFLTRSGKDFDYGFWEPAEATEGRCSLKSAMAFMSDHMNDPIKNSVPVIAEKNKLDVKDVENIITYFSVLKVITQSNESQLAYTGRMSIEPGNAKKE